MKPPTFSPARKAQLGMTAALGAAVIAGAALALSNAHSARANTVRAEADRPATAPTPAAPADKANELRGKVMETVAVSNYTYLRLSTATGEVWAAVPSAQVATGSQVSIGNAVRMDHFESRTLARTFEEIYFGTLAAPAASAPARDFSPADILNEDEQALPPGHPDIGSAAGPGEVNENDPLPPGHPSVSGAAPHGGTTSANSAITDLPSEPIAAALGANAHVIAQLTARRAELVGTKVRVRGQVTKVTPNVQGRTFFHIRDGNPRAAGEPVDLVVTSTIEPRRGEIAVFEGILRAEVDMGIGYSYPLLLESANVVRD